MQHGVGAVVRQQAVQRAQVRRAEPVAEPAAQAAQPGVRVARGER
ncbi:hypothetical protein [Kineococcus glutinatus]